MRKFGLINRNGGGFFSNFFVSLSLALDTEKENLIPYIVLDKTIFTKYDKNKNDINSWNWWFEQQLPNSDDIIVNLPYLNDNNFYYLPPPFYYGTSILEKNKLWNRNEINKSREFFNKYFKIHNHILLQIEEYYLKYLSGKINLGVMIRGTEFNVIHPQFGNQTIYDYISVIKNVLELHPDIENIFVVTEDSDYLKILEKEFNIIFMNVFRRVDQPLEYCKYNWEWPYEYNLRSNHTKILGDECLIQTLLLGKCDYLICKENGISAGAIFFKENIKDVFYV